MPKTIRLYIDDSGTRNLDLDATNAVAGRDWFGLGGMLITDEAEFSVRAAMAEFRARWPQLDGRPLHSNEIRQRKNGFAFLSTPELMARFGDYLTATLGRLDMLCTAAVIDRPGHRVRYSHLYSREQRWMLCKTAFAIVVERACKYAAARSLKLRVYVERGDKTSDGMIRSYYESLKRDGMPFNAPNMSGYLPLVAREFRQTLYELRLKAKSSPPMQVADLVLYPLCIGGYDPENRALKSLRAARKLLDQHVTAPEREGIKYSCFGAVQPR